MQRQVDNRRRALSSRLAIDDAISDLCRTTGCTGDEAFSQLWTRAGRDETRLWEIVSEPPQDPISP